MTSLLGARKRAEEFAAAIDDPATRTPAASPELPELAELVALVGALRTHEPAAPRPDFSTTLRAQLVAEAERTLAEDATLTLRPRQRGVRERRLALLASSLVLVGGSAGMAVAAQDALPGDALYPIKRGIEKAQTDLSRNDTAKGRDYLAQADSRLTEVQGIVDTSAEPRVPATISDFTAQAKAGSALLLQEFEDTQDPALVTDVRSFARDALDTLQAVAAKADSQNQDDLADAAAALLEIDGLATAACPSCAEGEPALQMPQPFLVAEEANRALDATRHSKELGNDHPPLAGSSGTNPGSGSKGSTGKGTTETPSTDDNQTDQGGDGSTGGDTGTDDGGGLLPGGKGTGDGLLPGGKKGDGGLLGGVDEGTKQLLPGLDPLLDSLLP